MSKPKKYAYVFVIQGYYSGRWEDENEEDNRMDARRSLREYRENMPDYPHRQIQRREPPLHIQEA